MPRPSDRNPEKLRLYQQTKEQIFDLAAKDMHKKYPDESSNICMDKMCDWFQQPLAILGNMKPIDMLDTLTQASKLLDYLKKNQ